MYNIILAADYGAEYAGNFVPSLIALKNAISSSGGDVVFVLPKRAEGKAWSIILEQDNLVYYFDPETGKDSKAKMRSIAETHNCKLIHTHFGYIKDAVNVTRYIKNVKVVWHVHSDFGVRTDWYRNVKRALSETLYFKNVKIIGVSPHLQNQFVTKKITYIPNAIVEPDKRIIPQNNKIECDLREKYNIQKDEIVVLMFGWHLTVKGVDIAAKAMNLLTNKNRKVKLAVVYGPRTGLEVTKDFISSNTSEEFSNSVIYLPQVDDVFAYHKLSDIFLSASRSEGFPYSILEALYSKKIIVSSDIPGTKWIKEFENALCFTSENEKSCAESIENAINLLKNDNSVILNKTKNSIEEKYCLTNWVNRVLDIYNK